MKPDLFNGKSGICPGPLVALLFSLAFAARCYSIPPSITPPDSSVTRQTAEKQRPSSDQTQPRSAPSAQDAGPGISPVAGDVPASAEGGNSVQKEETANQDQTKENVARQEIATFDSHKGIKVGNERVNIKPGSIDDVSAVGNRNIGGRGMGNWYSTESEIKMGKTAAMDIENGTRFITDPIVTEYVNRVGQNIVRNSDCKVPFTIKIIDSDEINAMALPGGFFYVNSGLILSTDEEAEMAGVMAHEIAHVCAHHAARQMTRMRYTQLGMVPLILVTGSGWAGFGIYQATQFAVPVAFLKFSRDFEAQADYLGIQYAYRTGYDPQATITFFEKVQALERRKPGTLAKAFSDHPQTPDRIVHSQETIAGILPARDQYIVTTSEFDDVKARLARIENKRRLADPKDKDKPSLRRASRGTDASGPESDDRENRPTLQRREDEER